MEIPPPSIGARYLLERLSKAEHMNAVLIEQLEVLAKENADLKGQIAEPTKEAT